MEKCTLLAKNFTLLLAVRALTNLTSGPAPFCPVIQLTIPDKLINSNHQRGFKCLFKLPAQQMQSHIDCISLCCLPYMPVHIISQCFTSTIHQSIVVTMMITMLILEHKGRHDDDDDYDDDCDDDYNVNIIAQTYLIFVIFFTRAKFLENKTYTEKRQFFALNL